MSEKGAAWEGVAEELGFGVTIERLKAVVVSCQQCRPQVSLAQGQRMAAIAAAAR